MVDPAEQMRNHAQAALRVREASPYVLRDARGYAPQWEHNPMDGLPLSAIESDLVTGRAAAMRVSPERMV
jgi:hypothetical protein